jgi:hypothetical protein
VLVLVLVLVLEYEGQKIIWETLVSKQQISLLFSRSEDKGSGARTVTSENSLLVCSATLCGEQGHALVSKAQ